MEVTINMNDDVRVELTEYGAQIIEEHPYTSGYYPKERVLKYSLWEMMQIFGQHCCMGKEAMFVSNRISVLDSTFENTMCLEDIRLKRNRDPDLDEVERTKRVIEAIKDNRGRP